MHKDPALEKELSDSSFIHFAIISRRLTTRKQDTHRS